MTKWLKEPEIKDCAYCGQKFIAYTNRKTCSQRCRYAMSLALGTTAQAERRKQRKKELADIREQAKKQKQINEPQKPPLEILERAPRKKGSYTYSITPDRPLTETSVWLIEEFFCKDGYTYEQIAKELNRDPEIVNRVIKEILLPDPRIQERLKRDIPKREALRASRKAGGFRGVITAPKR